MAAKRKRGLLWAPTGPGWRVQELPVLVCNHRRALAADVFTQAARLRGAAADVACAKRRLGRSRRALVAHTWEGR